MSGKASGFRDRDAAVVYRIHCPDVIEMSVDSRSDLAGRREVAPDGRINLGSLGRLRVEGHSVPEGALMLADIAGVAPDRVHLKIAEFNSQQIYLYGQVIGRQRTLPYQGPETVVDLLQRAGGITPGAAVNHVYVVRTRIADGQPPEVFPINLQAIVTRNNQQTNLLLQPFDQVYIGETRKASLEKCIPPFLRPVYETVCGMRRPDRDASEHPLLAPLNDSALARKSPPQSQLTIRGKGDPDRR
jgi:protein involved in polysaccharide export with SLBB domain